MAAVTSVAGEQVTYQQVTAAENIQREVTVVIVVGIEELAGLVAMHWHIGAIKIQHGLLRWFVMQLNEVMPQQFVGFYHRLSVHSLPHPAKGRLAS